jgi:hypothetical protein
MAIRGQPYSKRYSISRNCPEEKGAFANFGPDRRGFREANRVGLILAAQKPEYTRRKRKTLLRQGYPLQLGGHQLVFEVGSSTRTRTWNQSVNSRLLCRLSYRGR